MNSEVKDSVAYYRGPVDAVEIALALSAARDDAKSQDIREFRVSIPNAEWNVVTELFRMTFKGVIEPDGDNAVTVRYKFVRRVTVDVIGASELSQSVPPTLDLAHRRVVGEQTNGIESL